MAAAAARGGEGGTTAGSAIASPLHRRRERGGLGREGEAATHRI